MDKIIVTVGLRGLKYLLFFLLLFVYQKQLLAQSKRSVACKLASDLKSGTLVVVLKTNSKKLMWLEKFARTGNENSQRKFSRQLNRTIADRDSSWKYITLGFSQLYRFSEVAFLMDTSISDFLEDPKSCAFYDAKLQRINKPLTGSLFVCKYGHTFEDQSTNLQHAWYVMDAKLHRLQKPFPEVIQFSLFNPSLFMRIPKEFMKEFHISKIGETQRPLQHALKLNNELIKFYTKKGDCE